MKKLLVFALLALSWQARAQDALVVSACGTPPTTYAAGQMRLPTVDTTGKLCLSSSGGSATPGGSNTQIQFNDSGAFNGATSLTLNKATGVVTASSGLTVGAGSSVTSSGPGGALTALAYASFGTASGNAAQGGVITAGGPTGSATAVPVLTYNAAGQLTAVSTATIASPVTSKVINSTRDLTTASGSQVVSGFGFTPSSCQFFGAVSGGTYPNYTSFNGFSDSTLTQAVMFAGPTVGFTASGVILVQDAGGNTQSAAVTAYGSGTVTLSWTKTNSPTGTFSFSTLCFK